MNIDVLISNMRENLSEYAIYESKIRRNLPIFENLCDSIIDEIELSSKIESENLFDQLLELQGILSQTVFLHDMDVGEKLMFVVKEFERFHDPYTRELWFNKFKNGLKLPNQSK